MYRDGTLLRNVQGRNITKDCTGTEHYYGMYMDRTLRNVHGRNIAKVRLSELCSKYVQTVTVQVNTKPVYSIQNSVQTGLH